MGRSTDLFCVFCTWRSVPVKYNIRLLLIYMSKETYKNMWQSSSICQQLYFEMKIKVSTRPFPTLTPCSKAVESCRWAHREGVLWRAAPLQPWQGNLQPVNAALTLTLYKKKNKQHRPQDLSGLFACLLLCFILFSCNENYLMISCLLAELW